MPRDLVYWCLRRRGVPEKQVRLVEATYHDASTVVRTMHGRTDEFPIKVGLHQGSVLRSFLFIVVFDVTSEEFRCGLPSELLFADDLAVVTDTEEEMQRSWLGCQIGMEKGTKSQYRENGSDGQQQQKNKSKYQKQLRHEPQTVE